MTAAEQLETAVAKPEMDALSKLPTKDAPEPRGASQAHLYRRSSFQKIMHMCNQGYSAFPHVLIRLQDVHTTISIDFTNLILASRSLFLNFAVTLAIITLFAQFVFFFVMAYHTTLKGPLFLASCVIILGLLAFRCLSVTVVKRVHRSLSCRKKMD